MILQAVELLIWKTKQQNKTGKDYRDIFIDLEGNEDKKKKRLYDRHRSQMRAMLSVSWIIY